MKLPLGKKKLVKSTFSCGGRGAPTAFNLPPKSKTKLGVGKEESQR